jgi:hypothetical protein
MIPILNNIPPSALRETLWGSLTGGGGIAARIAGRLRKGQNAAPPRRLHMVAEMGRVPQAIRPSLEADLRHFTVSYLLAEPKYARLARHGAALVSHSDAAMLLNTFGRHDSGVVSAWVVSHLPAGPLAEHLSHAAFAQGPDKKSYLSRWYDPLITPVLCRLGDPAWVKWLFSPIVAWWYPADSPSGEAWRQIKGRGKHQAPPPVPLVCGEELWEALVSDPLPYQILEVAEAEMPRAFKSGCAGVRVAVIEEILKAARKEGLRSGADLKIYALALIDNPARGREKRWQKAVRQAAAGQAPLSAYFAA